MLHALLQEKLDYRHAYQEQLELVYSLSSADAALPPTASTAEHICVDPSDSSLLAVQKRQDLKAALQKVVKLEQQHSKQIPSRWAQDSAEFREAALQRKCFHIHQLQNKIVAELDCLHWSKLVVSRTPRQHRGTSSNILSRIRSANARLQETLQRLQEWHAVSGNIGTVPYDPSSLDVKDMTQAGWQAPWLHQTSQHDSLRQADVEQRAQRCEEELSILAREAKDMVEYYQHMTSSVESAINKKLTCPEVEQAQSSAQEYAYSELYTQRMTASLVAGQVHELQQHLLRCQQLQVRAEAVSEGITAAERGGPVPPIPAFDKQQLSMHVTVTANVGIDSADNPVGETDPADIPVADFDDFLVASIADEDAEFAAAEQLLHEFE